MSKPQIFDFHAHFVPPALCRNAPASAIVSIDDPEGRPIFHWTAGPPTRPMHPGLADLEGFKRWTAKAGLDGAVTSVWPDLMGHNLSPKASAEWTDKVNLDLSDFCGENPWLGVVALQDPKRAARQLEDVMEAGALGVQIPTSIADIDLADKVLDPFWEAASRVSAFIFPHPVRSDTALRLNDPMLINTLARPVQTLTAGALMALAGIPQRFPGARIMLAHGGGSLPYLAGRLRNHHRLHGGEFDPGESINLFWYDTVVSDARILRLLVEMVGTDRILPGSDYPYPLGDQDPVSSIRTALTPDQAEAIFNNSQRLIR